jgi:hypothetical protein
LGYETNILASVTVFAIFCLPSASREQGRVDIVQIYFTFLASRVAALGCNAIDKATELKFLSNQQTVLIRATQAFKERNANLSDAELTAKIIAAQNTTSANVKAEIAKNGCSSERIQSLLKLYKLHSEMSLGG